MNIQNLIITEKTVGCKNNHENSCTTKVSKHITLCFSMSKISSFWSMKELHEKVLWILKKASNENN